jgi:phosphatidylglycerophosphate synthase
MGKGEVFTFLNEKEEKGFGRWRTARDRLFKPLSVFLAEKGVLPEHASLLGILSVAPFIYFFKFNPWLSFVFLLLNIFFDGLDGPLARIGGRQSKSGAFTDFVCDHFSFLVIFMTMFYFQMMNGFWAALYLVNYLVMLTMVIYCRAMKIRFFPVVRSKYVIYLFFLIWLTTSANLFDPVIVFFTVYMVITNIFLFQRIRWALR